MYICVLELVKSVLKTKNSAGNFLPKKEEEKIRPNNGGSTFAKINRIRSSPPCALLALVPIELDKARFIAVHSFAQIRCIVAQLYCDEQLRAGQHKFHKTHAPSVKRP